MDEASSSKGQRPRLTCTECYRRKIKCDKNVPCSTCTRRGYASFCTREDPPAASIAPPTYEVQSDIVVSGDLVQALLDRVGQLEARLKDQDAETQDVGTQRENSIASPELPDTIAIPDDDDVHAIPTPNTTKATDTDDAATVLEFLAWGRKKDANYGTALEHNSGPRRFSVTEEENTLPSNLLAEHSKDSQLDILEALLPSKNHILQLVDYHNSSILWYHGSYCSAMLKTDLDEFLTGFEGDVRHQDLNLQWLALLFAILTGSITCAPKSMCRTWGFSESERSVLSRRWYEATVTCLNISRYIEEHMIYSVQAIATLTIAAHMLGNSSSQSVLLAAAGRIAQSLGLHRLGAETGALPKDQLRQREAGRRVFNQLCTQDWFQIPFSESYSLNPRFFQTAKPLNCNDDDMVPQPQSTPTQASYCNYRYDIAALMPQLLDATAGCNTLFTKYEQVLHYDEKMRKLATACMPTFLSTNAPVANSWPIYVGWARRSLAICASHKIIMIHRKFLGISFINSAFSFTRRTCIAASKTILKEALSANDEQGPVLWIEQAFSVAAGIILSLDSFHRSKTESEYDEHVKLVADAITYLQKFENSKIASRGVRLLSALQQELRKGGSIGSRKRPRGTEEESATSVSTRKRARVFDVGSFISNVSRQLNGKTPVTTPGAEMPDNIEVTTWDSFMSPLPPQTGFGGYSAFDDLLSFQF